MTSNFVFPEELSFFIESIRPWQLQDVGTRKWLECHEMIIKLSQQAILEAAEHREEEVKEQLIVRDKLKVLIHEAYCVFLWKTRVLPHLLEVDPNPQATFLIYTVFFHEGAVISLLDTALFHISGCEALQDSAIDLVDYCAQGVAQLIGLASMGHHENASKFDVDEAVLSELERQKRDLIYKIGLRCISICNYLADNANSLPLSAQRRMIATHDLPWLMVDLLFFRPWQRSTKQGLQKYIAEQWTTVKGDAASKIVQHEAQSWFCLRQLLFNTKLMESYEMNEERCKHLAKCQGLLHETVLDQLPPLIELKEYLCRLCVSPSGSQKTKKADLLLEEVPQISEQLIIEAERVGGFLAIAQEQEGIFLCKNKDQILEMAQRLNSAYNTDLLAELESKVADLPEGNSSAAEALNVAANKCGNCMANAEKKCANCKAVFYCSRKCQVDDWPKHKINCIKV